MGCFSCTSPAHWGLGLQPRHEPWWGIEPATLWFAGQHSIHWATPARAHFHILFNISLSVSTREESAGIIIDIVFNLKINLGRINTFAVCNPWTRYISPFTEGLQFFSIVFYRFIICVKYVLYILLNLSFSLSCFVRCKQYYFKISFPVLYCSIEI